MCAPLSASEGRMICKECIDAATRNAEIKANVEEGQPQIHWADHPENCGCPCQHKPVGSWKGDK
jgi:hypothetical protein